jgi:hypothetical protein
LLKGHPVGLRLWKGIGIVHALSRAEHGHEKLQPVHFIVEDIPRRAQVKAHPALGLIESGPVDQNRAEHCAQNPEQSDDQNKIKENPFVQRDAHLKLSYSRAGPSLGPNSNIETRNSKQIRNFNAPMF